MLGRLSVGPHANLASFSCFANGLTSHNNHTPYHHVRFTTMTKLLKAFSQYSANLRLNMLDPHHCAAFSRSSDPISRMAFASWSKPTYIQNQQVCLSYATVTNATPPLLKEDEIPNPIS